MSVYQSLIHTSWWICCFHSDLTKTVLALLHFQISFISISTTTKLFFFMLQQWTHPLLIRPSLTFSTVWSSHQRQIFSKRTPFSRLHTAHLFLYICIQCAILSWNYQNRFFFFFFKYSVLICTLAFNSQSNRAGFIKQSMSFKSLICKILWYVFGFCRPSVF